MVFLKSLCLPALPVILAAFLDAEGCFDWLRRSRHTWAGVRADSSFALSRLFMFVV